MHMTTGYRRGGSWSSRRGNMLIGCLTVMGIVLVVLIVGTVFVVRSYRGWIAKGVREASSAALVEMQLDDQEQAEVMGHVQVLLDKYTAKDIDNAQFFGVFEKLVESPLVAAAMVGGIDRLYFGQSGLSDEEKAGARVQLRRYANGLFEKDISPDSVETVLASVSTTTPDDNDIRIQYQTGPSGTTEYALRSADEVSDEDLRELIRAAGAKADEAGVEANPGEIDISDTVGIAIAEALGEDPEAWVPGAERLLGQDEPSGGAAGGGSDAERAGEQGP